MLIKLDNFTNPEQFVFGFFMLILTFIQTLDYFPEIPDGWFFFGVVITTPGLDYIDNIMQLLCNTTEVKW